MFAGICDDLCPSFCFIFLSIDEIKFWLPKRFTLIRVPLRYAGAVTKHSGARTVKSNVLTPKGVAGRITGYYPALLVNKDVNDLLQSSADICQACGLARPLVNK